ncbi:MAG: hypothetical protein ACTHMD_02490 [Flavisolibacter sp.]
MKSFPADVSLMAFVWWIVDAACGNISAYSLIFIRLLVQPQRKA